jgi:hypothetical protein
MALRTEVAEFQKHCDAIVGILLKQPALLTDFERLEIETGVTRIMSALIQAQQARNRPPSD